MTSQCSIEDFPPEILQILFVQLNLKDLGNCSKTCVRWKLLIADLFKNKGIYKGYLPFLHLSTKILMPCPLTGPKTFRASPNFLCQTKNLFTYCGSHKNFVPDKKMICIQ